MVNTQISLAFPITLGKIHDLVDTISWSISNGPSTLTCPGDFVLRFSWRINTESDCMGRGGGELPIAAWILY